MLDAEGVDYRYREYRKDPLSEAEIRVVLALLDLEPAAVLRRTDKVAKELSVTGNEPANELIGLMAAHPTLLQRPIGVLGDRAALGRPPERLLELLT